MLLAKSEVDLFAFLANFLHFCINFQHLCKLLVSYYTFQYQEKCTQVSTGIAISQLIYQRLKQLLLIVKPSNLLFNVKFFFIHFSFGLRHVHFHQALDNCSMALLSKVHLDGYVVKSTMVYYQNTTTTIQKAYNGCVCGSSCWCNCRRLLHNLTPRTIRVDTIISTSRDGEL